LCSADENSILTGTADKPGVTEGGDAGPPEDVLGIFHSFDGWH
jgi:hypothetical protein